MLDIQAACQALEGHPDVRVVHRLTARRVFTPVQPGQELATGVVLDTETTGRAPGTDRLIELGMVKFLYDPLTGEVCEVLDSFNALEDPLMPIPPEATRVNGISDEMVAGQRIDDDAVRRFVEGTDIVIAHNASFDRAFCETRFPVFKTLAWGCSRNDVDWEAEGIGSQKLDYISYRMGFFYDAHRADADCQALLEILSRTLQGTGHTALASVLENAQKLTHRLWATGAPFELKDTLKARGYRWNGEGTGGENGEKAWYLDLVDGLDAEIEWLKDAIFKGRKFSVVIDTLDARSRYAPRRGLTRRHYGG